MECIALDFTGGLGNVAHSSVSSVSAPCYAFSLKLSPPTTSLLPWFLPFFLLLRQNAALRCGPLPPGCVLGTGLPGLQRPGHAELRQDKGELKV